MKTLINRILLFTAALVVLFTCFLVGCTVGRAQATPKPSYGYIEGETLYPKAYVVTWRQDNGYCHLSDGYDAQGQWVVYAEDFFDGDIITCTMGDMATPDDYTDDRMILHYYSGWNIISDTGSIDAKLP